MKTVVITELVLGAIIFLWLMFNGCSTDDLYKYLSSPTFGGGLAWLSLLFFFTPYFVVVLMAYIMTKVRQPKENEQITDYRN